MYDLMKGEIKLQNINISIEDTLTDVLNKTSEMKKQIQNEDNHYALYYSEVLCCDLFTHCSMSFSEIGQMKEIFLHFLMGDNRNSDKKIFLDFLKKNHLKEEKIINKGNVKLIYEPHFKEYSILISCNNSQI